jgi:hypothetical protein
MTYNIIWKNLTFCEYKALFQVLSHTTLLQAYPYAKASATIKRIRPRWVLLQKNGQNAGLAQILEAKVLGLQAITLDRGPLWFEGFGSREDILSFADVFAKTYPRGFFSRRRFMPEIEETAAAQEAFTALGFKRQTGPGYQTLKLDIRPSLIDLRANLRSNWLGSLKKAERSGLVIEKILSLEQAGPFFAGYALDKLQKNYPGPEPAFLKTLSRHFAGTNDLLILQAKLDSVVVAGILLLCHGRSATYQAGWTGLNGRSAGAHHRLLWQAVEELKIKGIDDFDLGGVNEETAQSIKTFKQGLGGRLVTLAGLYN